MESLPGSNVWVKIIYSEILEPKSVFNFMEVVSKCVNQMDHPSSSHKTKCKYNLGQYLGKRLLASGVVMATCLVH